MTEGRYPPDDMFKADFEGSRPPRKPTIKERMSDALESASTSLSSKSRRKTQLRHSLPAKPAPLTRDATGADSPSRVIQHATKIRTPRPVSVTPEPIAQVEEDARLALDSSTLPVPEPPAEVVELESPPFEFDQQNPAPVTRRQTGAGMSRSRPAPVVPEPIVEVEETAPIALASPTLPLADPPALPADLVVEQAPPHIFRRQPPEFVVRNSPVDFKADPLQGGPTDPESTSDLGRVDRENYSAPESWMEDKDWQLPNDSRLFGYSAGDELRMPESPLERLRGLYRSIGGRRADEKTKSSYQSSDEPLAAEPGILASTDSPSRVVESVLALEAEAVDPVPADEAKGKRDELQDSTLRGELRDESSPRSSVAGFLGRFMSPDLKARSQEPVTAEQGVPSSPRHEKWQIPESSSVAGQGSSSIEDTANKVPSSKARGPSVGVSMIKRDKFGHSGSVPGVTISSLMASASALVAKSRGGHVKDSASLAGVDAPPAATKSSLPVSAPTLDAKAAPDSGAAIEGGQGPIPGSRYVPRHSASRSESVPRPPLAPAGDFEPALPKQGATAPANRRSEAKSPPSMPFVPPRRDRARRRSSGSVVAGGISLGLIIVISVGVASLNNSQSVKSTSIAPVVTTTPTTRVAPTTTPTTLRTSGADSAPTTLPQPKSIIVATTTPRKSNTTLLVTTTTKVTAIANPAYAQITVRVANGTTISGAAGKVTSKLKALGFNVVVPINATVGDLSTTTVYYYTGFSVAGQAVAQILGLPSSDAKPYTSSAPLPSIYPSDVNVVLGTDVAS